MKRILAVALLGSAVIGGAAFAQSTQPADRAAAAAAAHSADAKMAFKGNWRASKLMGLNVYNENNEKLGDVNELLVDKSGKINAVVIGIGGFLGMGEHDIAVSMEKVTGRSRMIAKRCVIALSCIIGPCSTGISTSRRTLPSGVTTT